MLRFEQLTSHFTVSQYGHQSRHEAASKQTQNTSKRDPKQPMTHVSKYLLDKCLELEMKKNNKWYSNVLFDIIDNAWKSFFDMCGVEGKRRLCDLNVTSSSPALATRHIRCVLLVNSPNKLNLLSWLLIYLCNK